VNDQRLGIPARPEIITVTFALLVCFSVARSRFDPRGAVDAVSIASVRRWR